MEQVHNVARQPLKGPLEDVASVTFNALKLSILDLAFHSSRIADYISIAKASKSAR